MADFRASLRMAILAIVVCSAQGGVITKLAWFSGAGYFDPIEVTMDGCDQESDTACYVPAGTVSHGQVRMKALKDDSGPLTCQYFINGLVGLTQCPTSDGCRSMSPSCPIRTGQEYKFTFEVDTSSIKRDKKVAQFDVDIQLYHDTLGKFILRFKLPCTFEPKTTSTTTTTTPITTPTTTRPIPTHTTTTAPTPATTRSTTTPKPVPDHTTTGPAPLPGDCKDYTLNACHEKKENWIATIHTDKKHCQDLCRIIYKDNGCKFFVYTVEEFKCSLYNQPIEDYYSACDIRNGPRSPKNAELCSQFQRFNNEKSCEIFKNQDCQFEAHVHIVDSLTNVPTESLCQEACGFYNECQSYSYNIVTEECILNDGPVHICEAFVSPTAPSVSECSVGPFI